MNMPAPENPAGTPFGTLDLIPAQKYQVRAGLVWHTFMPIGERDAFGRPWVVHNNPASGVHISPGPENEEIFYVPPIGPTFPPDVVITRALSRLGEPYGGAIGFNCERFLNWAQTGAPVSEQVNRAVVVGGGGLLLLLAFWPDEPKKRRRSRFSRRRY